MKNMESTSKYIIGQVPDWISGISDEDLVAFSKESTKQMENLGKSIFYLSKEAIRTSNFKNEFYSLREWSLDTSDYLQSASITEFFLGESEFVTIHRVSVIRNGEVIDKLSDLNIRVLDDERDSSYGSINKIKKVHCIVNGLSLHDVFVFEFTIERVFSDDHFLDKKYFSHVKNLPIGYQAYSHYIFEVFQEREESLKIVKKYFRNTDGKGEMHTPIVLHKGERFILEEQNFKLEYDENVCNPYVEISTDTSWKEIAGSLYPFYRDILQDINLKESEVYSILKLGDSSMIDDKIQRIIEYVQNEIIYLYDAEVMHEHLPQSPFKTLELKSGDCKAKSLLLISLLKCIGVHSEFILVNYSQDLFLPESLPSPFIFDHVIVRVFFRGNEYFVDPTIPDQSGILGKRAGSMLYNFLPIDGASGLVTREKFPSDINLEQNTNIILKKNSGMIMIDTLYRRESADRIRNFYKGASESQIVQVWNGLVLERLSFSGEKNGNDLIRNARYSIVSDDKRNNIFEVHYECALTNPYELIKPHRIFRYYYTLNFDQIKNQKHTDHPCDGFCSYPIKYNATIHHPAFFIDRKASKVKSTVIENDYFSYLNRITLSFRRAHVSSEYIPKTYGSINLSDLERLKEDYMEINASNFGIGIAYLNLWSYLRYRLDFLIIIFIIIGFIAELFA